MSSAVMIVFWLLIFVFLMMKDKKTKDRRKAAQADTAHEAEGAAEPKDEPQAQADYFGEGVPPEEAAQRYAGAGKPPERAERRFTGEGESPEEHARHMRRADAAQKKASSAEKRAQPSRRRFDAKDMKSAVVMSEVLGKPLGRRR